MIFKDQFRFFINTFLAFSFRHKFWDTYLSLLYMSLWRTTVIAFVIGAGMSFIVFHYSVNNPFGISLNQFLPYLFQNLLQAEFCSLLSLLIVTGDHYVKHAFIMYEASRDGEIDTLYVYKVNPLSIYVTPFLLSSVTLGVITGIVYILSSFLGILFFISTTEVGFYLINIEKYFSLIDFDILWFVFIKTTIFTYVGALVTSYYALISYERAKTFLIARMVFMVLITALAADVLFSLLYRW